MGMADGLLHIGDRNPVSGTPAWVSLEVAHGGFATGVFLAAGPLDDFESRRLASLGPEQSPSPRLPLNLSYLTEKGLRELLAMLDSGCFRVQVPEHAALLVVAYLATSGRVDDADDLLTTIEPWMSRLRFYPEPSETSIVVKSTVHLESVGQVAERLGRIEENARILTQNESLNVWSPLHDEFVRLVVDSCETYYDIDTTSLLDMDFGSGHVAKGLGELCANRVGVTLGGWSSAVNGCVIEHWLLET